VTRIILLILTLSSCKHIKSGYITSITTDDSGRAIVFIQQGKKESWCNVPFERVRFLNKNEYWECEE